MIAAPTDFKVSRIFFSTGGAFYLPWLGWALLKNIYYFSSGR
jgi:hypothetical protein